MCLNLSGLIGAIVEYVPSGSSHAHLRLEGMIVGYYSRPNASSIAARGELDHWLVILDETNRTQRRLFQGDNVRVIRQAVDLSDVMVSMIDLRKSLDNFGEIAQAIVTN